MKWRKMREHYLPTSQCLNRELKDTVEFVKINGQNIVNIFFNFFDKYQAAVKP